SCRSNPDFSGDNRGACIHMLAACGPHESGLEAGGVTRGEELFWIRSRAARPAHLLRHIHLHFECAIWGSCLSIPSASHSHLGCVKSFHMFSPVPLQKMFPRNRHLCSSFLKGSSVPASTTSACTATGNHLGPCEIP